MFLQKALDGRSLDILTEIGNHLLMMMNQGTVEHETAFLTAVDAIKREERKRFLTKYLNILEQMSHESINHDE